MKKIFLSMAIALSFGLGMSYTTIEAAEKQEIKLYTTDNNNDKLFSEEDGLWSPGENIVKKITLENGKESNIRIEKLYLEPNKMYDLINDKSIGKHSKEYKHILSNIEIVILDENKNELYAGDYKETKNGANLNKNINLNAKEKKNLYLGIRVSENLGNEGQGIRVDFDTIIGYSILDDNGAVIGADKTLPKTGGISSEDALLMSFMILGAGFIIYKKH